MYVKVQFVGLNQIQWNTLLAGILCITMAIIVVIWGQAPLPNPEGGDSSLKYLRHQQQVERHYVKQISTLLSSLLNLPDVHIQVSSEIDFFNTPFKIKRLAVIVILNDQLAIEDTRLDQLTDLIEQTVGIDKQRGDSLLLTHLPFHHSSLDSLSLPSVKQLFAGVLLFGLIVILWFLVRTLSYRPDTTLAKEPVNPVTSGTMFKPSETFSEVVFKSYPEQVLLARQIASQDPKHVAQIVKLWMANNG